MIADKEPIFTDGPFIESKEFLAGLAPDGSKACNRRLALQPFHNFTEPTWPTLKRKTMRGKNGGAMAIKSFALFVVLGTAHQAMAQGATTPYPKMAPIDQYLTFVDFVAAAGELLRVSSLLVTRDDCTSLGIGGNKVRKIEFSLAAAWASGVDCVACGGVASRCPPSSHQETNGPKRLNKGTHT